MGEIPEGTINLVGATLFRTNPSNQWLDKTFTITEEHLTKALNKAGIDIPATQDGLIQIYDIMASDFSEFTVACICTKPGWYDVTFDDWYEIINFPETGIYAYDKRTYGGNDYLKTFTFTVTTTSSNSPNGSVTGQINTNSSPIKYTGSEIQMFSRGICIGDSVTEGSFDNAQGGAVIKKYSYPSILKRLTNIDIVNAGIAGMDSQTWYEASLNSDAQWGKWVNQEWVWNTDPVNTGTDIISSALDYSGFDFAIIHMGINDLAPTYDGTKSIDDVLVNFETYMDNILTKLKTANNGIKIFLATIIPSYAPSINPTYGQLNDKIKEMVERTDNTYLLDLNRYSETATHAAYNVTHPTALGYQKLAAEIYSMISYIIKNNLDEFKSVQFIGSDYTI
jgi:lysophospholipase L1-like esterase